MKSLAIAAFAVVATAGVAHAAAPAFTATCPMGIIASSDGEGHAIVNGKRAKIKAVGNAWEVKGSGITISVGGDPLTADYTGPHRANGVCEISGTLSGSAPNAASGECPVDVTEADRYKYPACNGGSKKASKKKAKKSAKGVCPVDVSEADRYKYPACK